MKELRLALELHSQLDSEYAKRLFRATSRNQAKAVSRYTELRRLNDGAYFIIIFGTFERYVTDRARGAIKARGNKPQYRHRRAWETLLDGRIVFLNRVRLLLDQRLTIYPLIDHTQDQVAMHRDPQALCLPDLSIGNFDLL
jgi:hypothetical protein